MQITHKFRLYPNKQQEEKLFETLNLCRQTYNELLAEFSDWDNISKYELQSMIPNLKICNPTLKNVYSKTLLKGQSLSTLERKHVNHPHLNLAI